MIDLLFPLLCFFRCRLVSVLKLVSFGWRQRPSEERVEHQHFQEGHHHVPVGLEDIEGDLTGPPEGALDSAGAEPVDNVLGQRRSGH